MWGSRLNQRNDTVIMMITRGHEDHREMGVTPEGCLERKWRGHMEAVRQFEAIRLRSALNTRRFLEAVYGTRRAMNQ
jgi:hypothetical protein